MTTKLGRTQTNDSVASGDENDDVNEMTSVTSATNTNCADENATYMSCSEDECDKVNGGGPITCTME